MDSHVAGQERFVVCALDPPRYAMSAPRYLAAQHETLSLYRELQERRGVPMPVGLQEEAWLQFDKHRGRRLSAVDEFIDQGGFGIVAGLLAHDAVPPVYRLEADFDHARFDAQRQRASSSMQHCAELFGQLLGAYERIVVRCSPILSELIKARLANDLVARTNAVLSVKHRLGSVPPELEALARRLQVQPSDADAFANESRKLEQELRERSKRSSIAPRVALEIYLHDLKLSHGADPEYAGLIRACHDLLDDFHPQAVDEQILDKASQDVALAFMGTRTRLGTSHRPVPEGLQYMHLIDLATVLGVDVNKYPTYRDQAYAARLQELLQETFDFSVGRRVFQLLEDQEEEVLVAIQKSPLDREVATLATVMDVLTGLRINQIGYAPKSQEVLRRLNLADLTARLANVDPDLPPGCRTAAGQAQKHLERIIELNENTIRRGKLIGRSMLLQMNANKAQQALLACDGFYQEVLSDLFRADVDYSMVIPQFRV